MGWSFFFGLLAGSTLCASLKWLLDSRKKKEPQQRNDCLFFSPIALKPACMNTKKKPSCEALSCPSCNYKKFLTLMNTTKSHLDVCVYLITSNEITQTMLNLFAKGVFVRIITDKDVNEQACNSQSTVFMKKHVPIKMISAGEIMHNKFVIIDQKVVITGSFNWTRQAPYHNFENALIIHDENIVRQFSDYFKEIWLSEEEDRIEGRSFVRTKAEPQSLLSNMADSSHDNSNCLSSNLL